MRRPPLVTAIVSSVLVVLLFPITASVATNALPDSWKPYLLWMWLALAGLSVPVIVMDVRHRRMQPTASPLTSAPESNVDGRERHTRGDAWHSQDVHPEDRNVQVNVFHRGASEGRRVTAFPSNYADVIGREALLTDLYRDLHEANTGPRQRVRMRVLHGMAGVGKSSVAAEYARRYRSKYNVIQWIPVEDVAAASSSFETLVHQLDSGYETKALDFNASVSRAHALLADRQDDWLLIFDNAKEPDAIASFLPPAGLGHVLITSQNPHWTPPQLRVSVPPLTVEASVDLLLSTSSSTDQTSAELLAAELDSLPLALQQAGTYVAATPGATLAGYLQLFRERRAELLLLGEPPNYPETVATAWDVALEALSPDAAHMLRLLASYPMDNIPLALLTSPPAGNARELNSTAWQTVTHLLSDTLFRDTVLRELTTHSLITVGGNNDSVSVHRLIQAVTLDRLPTDERQAWRAVAAGLLSTVRRDRPEDRTVKLFELDMIAQMDAKDRARYLLQKRIQEKAEMAVLLSQLQSLRHQTAMSIINNIR
jgi:hypothetical protein